MEGRTSRPTRPTRPARPETPAYNPSDEYLDTSEDSSEEFDYETDLSIDPHYLDAEFLNHPMVFMKYSQESARANKAAKLAEERVKTTRSILIKRAKDSGDKHTETTLEAYYRLDPSYIQAKKDWVEATFRADLATNAVFAMQARKSALENLTRLHGQEYFSTPQEPRDLPDAAIRLGELKRELAVNHMKNRLRR